MLVESEERRGEERNGEDRRAIEHEGDREA
jgi:hypothetical protein